MKRVLDRQPGQVSSYLSDAVHALLFPSLVERLKRIHTKVKTPDVDPEQLLHFHAGIGALATLDQRLNTLLEEHSRWLNIERELRLIEGFERDIDQFGRLWTQVKADAAPAYQGRTESWAIALKAEGEKLDRALKAENPVMIRRCFRRYSRLAAAHVVQIVRDLKDVCDELRRIDEPLASLLKTLA